MNMVTYTGKSIDPLDPDPELICIEDIARALSMICRYGGHVTDFYSVAEHSVLVSQFVDSQYAREALMHDAAEAYIGDMIRPMKNREAMADFRHVEAIVEERIAKKFGLWRTPEALAAVKEIDDRIIVDEKQALKPHAPNNLGGLLGAEILGYSPSRAEILFLTRFWQLFPEFAPNDFEIVFTRE